MRLVFLQQDTMVKIAAMQLAAVLKQAGHECEVLVEASEPDLIGAAEALHPDAIAFSCTTGTDKWVLETARRVKERMDVPVIVGGPHATFFPDIIEHDAIDVVCRGEGEEPLLEFADALDGDGSDIAAIENLWVKLDGIITRNEIRPLVADLDGCPSPDWTIYSSRYKFMVPYYQGNYPVITSRGCPHRCAYCFNIAYQQLYRGKGRYVRRETPQAAVMRLKRDAEQHGVRRFNFVDDSIASGRRWLEEFAPLYRDQVGLPFICNIRADTITDETAQMLKDMGCYCARMGIESGNDRVRETILNKHVSRQQITDAARLIKAHGMKLQTYNIYGSPGETFEEALETLELNRELDVDFAQCAILQPYPGTPIRDYAEQIGAFREGADGESSVGSYFVESPLKLDREYEMLNLQKLTQAFIQLHVPASAVRRIVRLRADRLFHATFQGEYAWFRFRLDLRETVPFLRFALRSKAYMSARKPAGGGG